MNISQYKLALLEIVKSKKNNKRLENVLQAIKDDTMMGRGGTLVSKHPDAKQDRILTRCLQLLGYDWSNHNDTTLLVSAPVKEVKLIKTIPNKRILPPQP